MKIVKYVCDCCKKEFDEKDALHYLNMPIEIMYHNENDTYFTEVQSFELCGDCYPSVIDKVNISLSRVLIELGLNKEL